MTKKTNMLVAIFLLVTGIILWRLGVLLDQHYNWEESIEMIFIGMVFFAIGCVYLIMFLFDWRGKMTKYLLVIGVGFCICGSILSVLFGWQWGRLIDIIGAIIIFSGLISFSLNSTSKNPKERFFGYFQVMAIFGMMIFTLESISPSLEYEPSILLGAKVLFPLVFFVATMNKMQAADKKI